MPPLTVRADAKVPGKYWSTGGTVKLKHKGKKLTLTFSESNEGHMVVHKGELLSGILDKAVFGKFGLVHAVQVRARLSFLLSTCISLLPLVQRQSRYASADEANVCLFHSCDARMMIWGLEC